MQIINLVNAPAHLQTLAVWHHEEWRDLNPGQTLEQRVQKMQGYLGTDFIPSTYIACDDALLGSASIVESDMDDRKDLSPWLASVYVDKPYRRQGVGSRLVKHVIEMARQHGVKKLYLFTPDQESFYLQLGWYVKEKTVYRGKEVTIMCFNIY